MKHYLDASVIVSVFVAETRSQMVVHFLEAMKDRPVVSDYAAGEVASAISRHVRIGTFSADIARTILDEFDGWAAALATMVEVDTQEVRRASQIVRRFDLKLRYPDALHVAICENRGYALATGDAQMTAAATQLNVNVTPLL